jgi:hypothetical protein
MLKVISQFMVVVLLALFFPFAVLAEDHVVSTSDLQQAVQNESQTRDRNLQAVKNFLNSAEAQNVLKEAKINSGRIQQAVSTLSNEELARLAEQTSKINDDIAGGGLTTRQVTYIILGVTLVAVLIVVT